MGNARVRKALRPEKAGDCEGKSLSMAPEDNRDAGAGVGSLDAEISASMDNMSLYFPDEMAGVSQAVSLGRGIMRVPLVAHQTVEPPSSPRSRGSPVSIGERLSGIPEGTQRRSSFTEKQRGRKMDKTIRKWRSGGSPLPLGARSGSPSSRRTSPVRGRSSPLGQCKRIWTRKSSRAKGNSLVPSYSSAVCSIFQKTTIEAYLVCVLCKNQSALLTQRIF